MLYEGTEEFLAATLPFLWEGVAAGDPIIAVAHAQNVDALREALGDAAAHVDLRESSTWYHSPGRSFAGFIGFAQANPEATCVRMIGEPIWPVDWDTAVAEYAHYESVFNVIGKDAPIWALCPYDIGSLPDAILAHAQAAHPEIRTSRDVRASEGWIEPEQYCSHLAARPAAHAVHPRRFHVDADLAALRLALESEAREAGVSRHRIPEFLLAAHEVAMNAIAHGGGEAWASTWSEPRSFVFEVEDRGGPGLSETTAGYVPPDHASEHGRGLWLARQVCDYVEVRSRGGTTQVRLHVARG